MKTVLAIAVLFLALPVCAQHVHGEGRLDVVIDRDQLTLSLELPLDAAVGFERAPRNEAERAALANAGRRSTRCPSHRTRLRAARCRPRISACLTWTARRRRRASMSISSPVTSSAAPIQPR